MPNIESQQKVYKLFDSFIASFIIKKENCLFNEQTSFSERDLQIVFDNFVKNPIAENVDDSGVKQNFSDKLEIQFKGNTKAKKLFCHIDWLWAFAATDMKGNTKNTFHFEEFENQKIKPDFEMEDNMGIGGASPRQQKYKEIKLLIYIINYIWKQESTDNKKNIDEIIDKIKDNIVILINQNNFDYDDLKENLPIKNALLHLCKPDEYEPIFSHNHKGSIAKAFNWILDSAQAQNELDSKLNSIRKKLCAEYGFNDKFSFYDDGIRELWQIDDKKFDNLDEVQLLEFKKAMVLYGPPGTSKTYSALNLAKLLVARGMIKILQDDKQDKNIKDQLKKQFGKLLSKNNDGVDDVIDKYVDRLQMHINYNYEDFVAGQVIQNNNVVTKKGYIFNAIDKANQKPNLPFIVILDEINRADISRVFGEVFSAMEYRGKDIELPFRGKYEQLILNIPENLYFIGTMNEIDFSLERIDFALRRRFVWVLKTFDSSILKTILLKNEGLKKEVSEIDNYCKQCEELNNVIKTCPELGDNYVIGHTFFADIQMIQDRFDGNKKWDKSKMVLWQISIGPTIEAYCGSMEKSTKNKLVKNCAEKLELVIDDSGKISTKKSNETGAETENQ